LRRRSRRETARRGARIGTSPAAIVVAAGRGERAGSDPTLLPKQFRPVAGRPAVLWSIDVLARAGCSPIVVALPPDRLDAAAGLLGNTGVAFVAGGETRQHSVRNALEVVASDRILIHDGARPCVEEGLVSDVLAALSNADAVVPVLPVDDTLKEVDGEQVLSTFDRTRVRRVQTPQGFREEPLRAAHARAERDGFTGTDDAQLVERNGGRVVTVEGRLTNIKLTRPMDFAVAEMYLQR
jgi:2-C-methyl-D-erythritol 4-phosphate cytidylyltransferase